MDIISIFEKSYTKIGQTAKYETANAGADQLTLQIHIQPHI